MLHKPNKKGFTLIELLVVIGILAVLLAIVLVAINPGRQFQQANDTKRQSDINSILNAINQYMAANQGSVPAGITGTATEISSTGANICSLLVPTFIAQLPVDPTVGGGTPVSDCTGSYATGYQVSVSSNRITVTAPSATTPASVTR